MQTEISNFREARLVVDRQGSQAIDVEAEGDNVPEEQRTANNSQTYVVDADEFAYETVEHENGQATVVRFQLSDPQYHAGDVVVVLSGAEIHFHGMIGRLADGWATATDRRGSLLPATVQ